MNFTEPGTSLGLTGPFHTPWCTPSFPRGTVWCQHPLKGWEPWCSWGGLAAPGTIIVEEPRVPGTPRAELVSSGHKPAERALLGLSFGQRTKKSQTGPTFIKWSNFALLLPHNVLLLGILNCPNAGRGTYSSL